jgi:hypothetical protein
MARVLALRDRVMRVAVRGWLAGGPLPGASDIHDAPAASESLWLRLYGAAAMAALMVFRLLFPGHVARAWRVRKNPGSGLSMLCLVLLLVVTGYRLYYAGDEETRPWISMAHWITAVPAASGLVLHACLGKRSSQSPPTARGLHRRLFDVRPSGTEGPSEVMGRDRRSNAQ